MNEQKLLPWNGQVKFINLPMYISPELEKELQANELSEEPKFDPNMFYWRFAHYTFEQMSEIMKAFEREN